MALKLTSWNLKHLGKLLPQPTPDLQPRLDGIVEEILEIDPDILCLQEASGNIEHMRTFAAGPLGGAYRLIEIPGTAAALATDPNDPRGALQDLYAMQGTALTGNQWIWFLVKTPLAAQASIQDPAVWQAMTGGSRWTVHYWGDMKSSRHSHWRHPQVLVLTISGKRVEFIGVHMKSKINQKSPFEADGVTLRAEYVIEALKARIKLATEATDVRAYIEARFAQEPSPAIFVMGDMNDGPGKELFERDYLFFDLISNIQGDVFFARRFLNHALFDFQEDLRWSASFKDRVDPDRDPEMLLDHILFTQGLVNKTEVPRIDAGAGLVEHPIHQRINALLTKKNETSDHAPVSVRITT